MSLRVVRADRVQRERRTHRQWLRRLPIWHTTPLPGHVPLKFAVSCGKHGPAMSDSRLGEFDILGEVTGGGRYEDLLPDTVELEAFGVKCRHVTLAN